MKKFIIILFTVFIVTFSLVFIYSQNKPALSDKYIPDFKGIDVGSPIPKNIRCSFSYNYDYYMNCETGDKNTKMVLTINSRTIEVDAVSVYPTNLTIGDYILQHGIPKEHIRYGNMTILSWDDEMHVVIADKTFNPNSLILRFVRAETAKSINHRAQDRPWRGFKNN